MQAASNNNQAKPTAPKLRVPTGKKPKMLLIHAQGSNWLPGKQDITRFANIMPPTGICSIAAYLQQRGVETVILDAYARPRSTDDMLAVALAHEPDVVGFSVTTSSFLDAYDIASGLKARQPELPLIFGGVHVSAMGEALLRRFPMVDFGATGEGEETMTELLEGGMDAPDRVPGLLYRDGGEVLYTGDRKTLVDLDALPFPAYEKLPGFPRAYHLAIFNYGKAPSTSTVTSRGCRYKCSYCDRSVYKSTFRYNSAEYIYEHVRHLRERFGIRHVTFYDDLFTYKRERVVELCTRLIDKPLGVTFACDVRVNHIDQELARLLKGAGCFQVAFGIESGDPEILKSHRRDPRVERVREVATLLRETGVKVKGLFMMGLPGEDEAAIRRTMDLAISLPLDEVNVSKFTPFPGAPLFEEVRKLGTFNEDWRRMNCMNFVFVPEGMTEERLEMLYSEFIVRFYNRFRVLWNYTTMLWRSPHSIYTFFRHLPAFLGFGLGMGWGTLKAKLTRTKAALPEGRQPT